MKFERVDEKTVRCFISNEELEGFQIDYKDFVMRSERAREVVREIIEQATEEVGYKPPKFAFDMSIMMMPDQGLVLTFSENDPLQESGSNKILEYLQEMKRALQSAAESTGLGGATLPSVAGNQNQEPPAPPEQGIFVFERIGDVMEFACAVPKNLRVHSELYRMDDRYFLYLQKGAAAYQRYSKLCVQAMEFGRIYGADDQKHRFLKEHGECLIAEKALRKLHAEHR